MPTSKTGQARLIALALSVASAAAFAQDEPRGEILVTATDQGVETRYLSTLAPPGAISAALPTVASPPPSGPAEAVSTVDVAPAPLPDVVARSFAVMRGELLSAVLGRWLAEDGIQLAWLAGRDLSIEAAATFRAARAVDAVQSLAEVLGRRHPELLLEHYDNDVIVVTWRNR